MINESRRKSDINASIKAAFPEASPLYTILDGALIDGLEKRLVNFSAEYTCLYRGNIEPWLRRIAPFLVRVEKNTNLFDWIIAEGWQENWGIFLTSSMKMRELRKHFRRHLVARIPGEIEPVYFRFYDPRVFPSYICSCDEGSLKAFFEGIDEFICNDRDEVSNSPRIFRLNDFNFEMQKI